MSTSSYLLGANLGGTGLYVVDTIHGGVFLEFVTAPGSSLLTLAVDPTATDGTAFAITQNVTRTYQLAKINLSSGVVTNVGPLMTIHPRGMTA